MRNRKGLPPVTVDQQPKAPTVRRAAPTRRVTARAPVRRQQAAAPLRQTAPVRYLTPPTATLGAPLVAVRRRPGHERRRPRAAQESQRDGHAVQPDELHRRADPEPAGAHDP